MAAEKTNLLQTYLNKAIAYKTIGGASAQSLCMLMGSMAHGKREQPEKESSKSDKKSRKCDLKNKGGKKKKV